MSITHIVLTIIFGAVIAVGGLLAADELVRLRRRDLRIWRTMWKPAAHRFRICVFLVAFGASGVALQWGNPPAVLATTSIVVAILAWNVWLAARTRRALRPGR
jgi:hypothetical protein